MSESQSNNTLKHFFLGKGSFWQTVLLSLTATIIWRIYYPGLMSPDSIDQYGQAFFGNYIDWHPPLMSLVLSVFLKTGSGIGGLILFQCFLAIFGLRTLIALLIRFFSNQIISEEISRTAATVTTLLFLVPFLSPFMFISVSFWKDTWLVIMLLWIVSYLLWVFLNFQALGNGKFIIHILLLSLASALMILVRHNAYTVLPVIGVLIAIITKMKLGNIGLSAAAIPLLLAIILSPLVTNVFRIKQVKAGNLVLSSDLTIMLRLYPELESEFPFSTRHEYTPMVCHPQSPVLLLIDLGGKNKALKDEYIRALDTHPLRLFAARLYLFWQMLSPRHWWKQKLAYDIIGNPYGLKINEDFGEIRLKLNKLSSETGNQWYFIWISGLHIVWLVLNILCVFYCLIKVFIKRNSRSIILLFLFLIPLSYYFSYVLAAVSPDYRYMYPSTLMMQVLIVSILLSKSLKVFQNVYKKS